MGGEQAAGVLATVRREGIERQGRDLERRGGGGVQGADARDVRAAEPSALRPARLWDDGVIDPRKTRDGAGAVACRRR